MNTPSDEENAETISSENLTKWVLKHLTSSAAREELLQIFPSTKIIQKEIREPQKRRFETVIKSEIEDNYEKALPMTSENLIDYNVQEVRESQSKCRCEEIIGILEKQEELFTKMFSQLSDEVSSLRKEIISLKKPKHNYDARILPTIPFKTVEEFLEFEKSLTENEDKFLNLRHELTLINLNDPEKFVKVAFKAIFNDKVAQQFCWRGTPEKQSVRDLKFTSAVKYAFHDKFKEIDEDVFLQATMKHFQYAKDRLQKKIKYSSLKTPNAAANSPS